MFITSRNFSQLRELISLADAERNNPEVILIGCRKHPEMIRRQSKYHRKATRRDDGLSLIRCPSIISQACSAATNVSNGEPTTLTAGLF
jgi:hypothetical protein